MKTESLTYKKKLSSGLMLTVILLFSFFMPGGNMGFSTFQVQKTQTEVPACFKPLPVAGINYYDNVAVLKKLHFPWSFINLINVLSFHHKMILIRFHQLKKNTWLITVADSFYWPKTIPQSQDEDDFSLMG